MSDSQKPERIVWTITWVICWAILLILFFDWGLTPCINCNDWSDYFALFQHSIILKITIALWIVSGLLTRKLWKDTP